MSYKCKIVADSAMPQGHRLTTYLITYPRIIHAEMCRHRMLSRNTASSRAIPFKKMVKDVQDNPFIPIAFQRDHKGMQGTEYIKNEYSVKHENPGDNDLDACIEEWLYARTGAVLQAKELNQISVTKQLCNRLLEPFMWTTELVSGTEWENFFELRNPVYEIDLDNLEKLKD